MTALLPRSTGPYPEPARSLPVFGGNDSAWRHDEPESSIDQCLYATEWEIHDERADLPEGCVDLFERV